MINRHWAENFAREWAENWNARNLDAVNVGIGSDALTIVYRNHRNENVAETLVFGDDGKIREGIVTYLKPPES